MAGLAGGIPALRLTASVTPRAAHTACHSLSNPAFIAMCLVPRTGNPTGRGRPACPADSRTRAFALAFSDQAHRPFIEAEGAGRGP